MKTPTPGDLLDFLRADGGWKAVRNTTHGHYEKTLDNGTVLSTHVSFGSRATVSPDTFKLIFAIQLAVTESEFWDTIRLKKAQRTSTVVAAPSADPLTLALRRELMRRLQHTDDQMIDMSGSRANQLLSELHEGR